MNATQHLLYSLVVNGSCFHLGIEVGIEGSTGMGEEQASGLKGSIRLQ